MSVMPDDKSNVNCDNQQSTLALTLHVQITSKVNVMDASMQTPQRFQLNASSVKIGSKSRQRASIRDVAEAAGVSIMTVSRAIRGIEGVSQEKRVEILSHAKAIGYRPNRNASSLAATRSTLIGVSLPTLFNEVFADILDGMRRTFELAGFDLILDNSDYVPQREADWVERMLDWHPAAVVLSGIDHSPSVREQLQQSGVPTLEIWDTCDDPIDICVGIDHRAAGRLLAKHLFALGYRRPTFVGIEAGRDPRAEKRLAGFTEVFLEEGCDTVSVVRTQKHASFEAGMAGTLSILKASHHLPDCICYLNDHMAFGGLTTCEKHGLDVPGHIGITGFNDLGINLVLAKPLTTVMTPRLLMGSLGAQQLLARIHNAKVEKCRVMSTTLVEGMTTRQQG
jgi:LacI family transcriptional regulator, gluconate utilization system Gnt-I transcriptional repressor